MALASRLASVAISITGIQFFGGEIDMSTKASITAGERHHLYFQGHLDTEPENVFLELTKHREYSVTKETTPKGVIDNLVVEIPAEIMDNIAIAWIKKRKLQGAVGGPVGNEWGSPNCPWE